MPQATAIPTVIRYFGDPGPLGKIALKMCMEIANSEVMTPSSNMRIAIVDLSCWGFLRKLSRDATSKFAGVNTAVQASTPTPQKSKPGIVMGQTGIFIATPKQRNATSPLARQIKLANLRLGKRRFALHRQSKLIWLDLDFDSITCLGHALETMAEVPLCR